MRVDELYPGDVIQVPHGRKATFIVATQHPVWAHLRLVIWRMDDGEVMFDALHNAQDVGERVDGGVEQLRKAIGIGS
jgi:hypothetical protein